MGSVGLRYAVAPDLQCPDEATFRGFVAARLGYDPFENNATSLITVDIAKSTSSAARDERISVELTFESPVGSPPRRKSLSDAQCTAVAQSAAITVAISVDTLLKREKAAPAPQAEGPRPPIQSAPPTQPVRDGHDEKPSLPLAGSVSAGASVMLGFAPTAQPTLRAEGRVHLNAWSIGLEARFGWPVTGALRVGAMTASSIMGALSPCLAWKWIHGCLDFAAGALRLEGSALPQSSRGTVFHSTLGLRAMLLIPVSSIIRLGVFGEGFVPLTRASAIVGNDTVWTVSPIAGGLGASISASL